jgi:hypothetical protein
VSPETAAYVEKLVAQAPPIRPEVRDRLAVLLRPARTPPVPRPSGGHQ